MVLAQKRQQGSAAQVPRRESVLLAAKMAGYAHVNIDGNLIVARSSRGYDAGWTINGRRRGATRPGIGSER